MGNAVGLVAAMLAPTALGFVVVYGLRGWRRSVDWWRARLPRTPEPIEQLGADLRRLKAQLEHTEDMPAGPGKGVRVRAIRSAYLDVLLDACARLDVTPPATAPVGHAVPLAEIYRVEAALRQRGLDVRAR